MNFRKFAESLGALIVIVIGSTVIISACSTTKAEQASTKETVKKEVIKDSIKSEIKGDLVDELRDVSGFTKVSVGGTIQSKITVGGEFRVVVRTEQDMLEKIKTTVKDGRLRVGYERGYWNNKKDREYKRKTKVLVTITLPTMDALSISGASVSNVEGVNSDKLKIDVSGASKVVISGNANDVDIDLSGASYLNAKQFFTQFAKVDASGASSTRINIASELKADASGASSIQYIGSPSVSKDTSGASSVSKTN